MPATYPGPMHLTATIRVNPADHKIDVSELESRDIVGTGDTYDDAKAALDGQIPDGWHALFVRSV